MKRIGALVFAISMIFCSVVAAQEVESSTTVINRTKKDSAVQEQEAFTFRDGITFGMTKNEVRAIEGTPDTTSDTADYYFDVMMAGKTAVLVYIFSDAENLEVIALLFDNAYEELNENFADFDVVDEALKQEYGQPLADRTFAWEDETYQGDEEQYGQAIRLEQLRVYSVWFVDPVKITHTLYGSRDEIIHVLEYLQIDP